MWAGRISSAFEWWKRDRTGKANKYGKRRVGYSLFKFKRNNFVKTEPGDDRVFNQLTMTILLLRTFLRGLK
jgi:hypothetical protein